MSFEACAEMFALVDCNNFYVSCERLFRPDLRDRPVAVLSNNDGCIISRSNAVKALGVCMGAPYFKVRDRLRQHGVTVFSSNYTLYGDLSARVMAALESASESVEVYSIDEAFVCCASVPPDTWEQYGHHLREVVARQVGLPVSVGLAPTKTLSKVANRIAKRDRVGAYALRNPGEVREALQTIAVEDIWGIGRRTSAMLNRAGVFTAADFVRLPEGWVRQRMTITGLTTHRELRGMMCMSCSKHPRPRRSMVHSRSFGRPIRDRDDLREAVARYTGRLSTRLRKYDLHTGYLRLFLVPPMRSDLPTCSQGRALPIPTADSRRLI